MGDEHLALSQRVEIEITAGPRAGERYGVVPDDFARLYPDDPFRVLGPEPPRDTTPEEPTAPEEESPDGGH